MSTYKTAMENLEKEHARIWGQIDREYKKTGEISEELDRILQEIEREMGTLRNAY